MVSPIAEAFKEFIIQAVGTSQLGQQEVSLTWLSFPNPLRLLAVDVHEAWVSLFVFFVVAAAGCAVGLRFLAVARASPA